MSGRDGNRLGRGLAALLGEAAAPARHLGPRAVPVEHLRPGPFQPRGPIDPDTLAELTASIQARGVLQPLLARPDPAAQGTYQIVAGERRWRAAQAAGLVEVPVLVAGTQRCRGDGGRFGRKPPARRPQRHRGGGGFRRLTEEFGMTQESLGQAVGKSRSHVANTMRLLNLPAMVQGEVRRGALSAGHARALLGHKEPEKAALAVIARGLNVRQTEALASEKTARNAPRPKDPETLSVERDLADRLGLRVELVFNGREGSLKIHYTSLDQLDGLIRLLSRE